MVGAGWLRDFGAVLAASLVSPPHALDRRCHPPWPDERARRRRTSRSPKQRPHRRSHPQAATNTMAKALPLAKSVGSCAGEIQMKNQANHPGALRGCSTAFSRAGLWQRPSATTSRTNQAARANATGTRSSAASTSQRARWAPSPSTTPMRSLATTSASGSKPRLRRTAASGPCRPSCPHCRAAPT